MHALTIVSCIGASRRTCRVVGTEAQVGIRGISVVARIWMTRDPRRKKKKKKKTKQQILFPVDEEEEGYKQRKSHALFLRALFRNPEDAKLMSWHASTEHIKGDGKLRHPFDGK
ncbi:hypothetical protein PVAP13_8NG251005 [Panicum virgatum]|uniref:Uncharacterized protein n=1 Tax=Panicum virgatum TaxID=38727 RepID=A0A8T0PF19_PANVG|nr:hypothetical protein PVAP13_8NG251005 [Panicum virgatum]